MYEIEYQKKALKFLCKMPKKQREAIYAKMDKIAHHDTIGLDITKLVGREGYRLRVGDYRVIYQIKHNVLLILVLDVDSRGGIYK